jgi:hypothetical protein
MIFGVLLIYTCWYNLLILSDNNNVFNQNDICNVKFWILTMSIIIKWLKINQNCEFLY